MGLPNNDAPALACSSDHVARHYNVDLEEAIIDGIRGSMCHGKQGYNHEDSALMGLEELRRKWPDTNGMGTYYCVFCNRWHIGRPTAKSDNIRRYLRLDTLLRYDFDEDAFVKRVAARRNKNGSRK